MNRINCGRVGTGVLVLLAISSSAFGAASYSNTLRGFTGDTTQAGTRSALDSAGLSVSTFGAGSVAFDADGAHFGVQNPSTDFLSTTIADYATVSFTADITFQVADARPVFFGMGSGVAGGGFIGVPDGGSPFSSASFYPVVSNHALWAYENGNSLQRLVGSYSVPALDVGTHRLRMTFDSATGGLVGAIDLNYVNGPFTADFTSPPIDTTSGGSVAPFAVDGWPSEPSSIFFGGAGVTFSDLTVAVVPEPASIGFVMLGATALLYRRGALR